MTLKDLIQEIGFQKVLEQLSEEFKELNLAYTPYYPLRELTKLYEARIPYVCIKSDSNVSVIQKDDIVHIVLGDHYGSIYKDQELRGLVELDKISEFYEKLG